MIERLRRALEHIDELPPDVQEEIAALIEESAAPIEIQSWISDYQSDSSEAELSQTVRGALAVIGAWRDMQDDDEFAALDRIRHESVPTPSIELDGL